MSQNDDNMKLVRKCPLAVDLIAIADEPFELGVLHFAYT
jgi:hypothetical protein